MGMYSNDLPPPPDYAAAQTAGVQADANTLPFRLAVGQAAQLGKIYTDPATGKVYDFTGLGAAESNAASIESARQLMQAGTDMSTASARQQLQSQLQLLPQFNQLNLQQQQAATDMALAASKQFTQNSYDQSLQYQPLFGDLQRGENAKTFAQNLALGTQGTRTLADLQNQLLAGTNKAGLDAQTAATQAGLAALKSSDPARWALQQKLLAASQSDLDAGSGLTPEQLNQMQQQIRGAQAARGNVLGAGAGYDEARMGAEMGQNLQMQRRQQALAVLQGSDIAPKYSSAQPVNPLMPNYGPSQAINPQVPNLSATTTNMPSLSPATINSNPLQYLNANAGAQGAAFTQGVYGTQTQAASQQVNPWAAGLGLAFQGLGAAGGIAGLAKLCWVAREVYGADNPRWLDFRAWVLTEAPAGFRMTYLKRGERFARLIHSKHRLKAAIRDWMENILTGRTKP